MAPHAALQVIKSLEHNNIINLYLCSSRNKIAELYLLSTFQTSDKELLSPKIMFPPVFGSIIVVVCVVIVDVVVIVIPCEHDKF